MIESMTFEEVDHDDSNAFLKLPIENSLVDELNKRSAVSALGFKYLSTKLVKC